MTTLKLTIPFAVAFPLILAALFGVGSFSIMRLFSRVCSTSEETHIGKFNVFVFEKDPQASWLAKLLPFISLSQNQTTTQAVLREANQVTEVDFTFKLESDAFQNEEVAAYGTYNPCDRKLTVKSLQNLIVLK